MCNSRIKMVTPTKSKHYNKAGQQPNGRHPMAKTPQKSGGSRHHSTPSPPNKTSMDLSFKTPQNPSKSRTVELMQQQQRCKSEPKALSRGRSVTPPSLSYCSSPPIFAGPKCQDAPAPTSLPRPPTTWTSSEKIGRSARQALSFDDLVQKPKTCRETIDDPVSRHIMSMLGVQA